MRRAAALVVAALAAVTPVAAEEPEVCYGVTLLGSPEFSEPGLRLVSPNAPKKLRFAKNGYDEKGCPAAEARCEKPAYVTPGDAVIVNGATGGFLCATYVGGTRASSMTIDWLPAASLADPKTSAAPTLADWVGVWRSGDEKTISIRRAGKRLTITGEASWGASDPRRVASGAVNTGEFEATVAPEGATAGFAMDGNGETVALDAPDTLCKVRLWRLGPYLVAADDGRCGGANVTFTSVYRGG